MILYVADGAEHTRISSLLKQGKSLSKSCLKQTHVEENVNTLRQSSSYSTPSNRVVLLPRRELTCEAENLLLQPAFSGCRANFSARHVKLILHKQKIIKMPISPSFSKWSRSICKHVGFPRASRWFGSVFVILSSCLAPSLNLSFRTAS